MDITSYWPVLLIAAAGAAFAMTRKSKAKPRLSSAYLGDIAFGPGQPDKRIFENTGGDGYVGADCMNVVSCFITFPGPLPDGEWHGGLMQRASLEGIQTGQFNGIGTIFGSQYLGKVAPNGMPSTDNQACVEVWQKGMEPEGFQHLKPGTVSPQFDTGHRYAFRGVSIFKGDQRTYRYYWDEYLSAEVTHDKSVHATSQALGVFCIGEVPVLIEELKSEWSALQ